MVKRYRLFIEYDICFGCYACEIACKQENRLPLGPRWIRVKQVGPREVNGTLTMDFVPLTCMHCSNPPCMDACPEDAITQREDGIVLISADLCIGCLACLSACPFGAPQINPDLDVVEKCNLCLHRIEKGASPACVQACPAGAIHFGDIHEITEEIRQHKAVFLTSG